PNATGRGRGDGGRLRIYRRIRDPFPRPLGQFLNGTVTSAMVRSLLLRIGQVVFVLLAAYTVTFGVLRLVPGDPVSVMLTSGGHEINTATPEQIATLTAKFGLDKSIPEQYISQLVGMLRGDFGFSYTTGNPVLGEIAAR